MTGPCSVKERVKVFLDPGDFFLAPLSECQRAIVMALCPSCVHLSVRRCMHP